MPICYKDQSFCMAAPVCANAAGCWRNFDHIEREKADLWAVRCGMVEADGTPAPRVAYTDFRDSCSSFEEITDAREPDQSHSD